MKKLILFFSLFTLAAISYGQGNWTLSGAKNRWANGMGFGNKDTSTYTNASDTNLLVLQYPGVLVYRHLLSDHWEILSYNSTVSNYKLISDSLFNSGYTRRDRTKQGLDSLGGLKLNISDTAAMLANRLKVSDTLTMLSNYALDYNVVHKTGTETITGAKTFLGTQTFVNAKFDSAIYFKVQRCCAPVITDTNYSGIAYRYTNLPGTPERIGRRALVSRFPLYIWERNDSKWMGSISDTGMGIGIDAADTINYVNETLDVRGNGIGSGNIRLLNYQNNNYFKNYGSSGYDQGLLFGNSFHPLSLPVTPTWALGINPSLFGGTFNDFTIGRQQSGSWKIHFRIDSALGSIKINTNNWPTATVAQNTNRIAIGGATTPVLLMWNEATPAANNRSVLQIGAVTGLGSSTISGIALTGGTANQYTYAGFGKIQTYNHSGTITDAISIDSNQNVIITGTAATTKIIGSSSTPSIAAGAGAGTSPTVSITGTDMAGEITIATGSAPSSSSVLCTVTFSSAYASAPYVVFSPSNSIAGSTSGTQGIYVNSSTGSFTLNTNSVGLIGGGTVFKWHYHVIQ